MSLSAGRVGVRADQVDSFGRVISPSFLNEIMEDLPEWTDLPVRVNGTEELIPSNPSVPVTSPILADIAYPDVRRNNQYFTYRESPTSVDGLAKIKSIKGNTLVWNQLQKTTANTSTVNGITYTNNGDGSWTVSGTATASAQKALTISADWITAISGHKYLMVGGLPNGGSSKWLMQLYKNNANTLVGTDSGNGLIYTADNTTVNLSIYFTVYNGNTVNGRIYPQIFDLTKMGLDSITSVDEFTSLFPLSYYQYDSGSLLSFNGTGIKKVGFNQWDEEWETGRINTATGEPINASGIRSKNFIPVFPNTTYYFKATQNCYIIEYNADTSYVRYGSYKFNATYKTSANTHFLKFYQVDILTYNHNICINISSSRNGEYEPYIENTTSLPIATYFPTGMKSAGSVYDELTPTKAVTRIGAVDLGSLSWYYTSGGQGRFASGSIASSVKPVSANTQVANIKCVKYSTISAGSVYNGNVGIAIDNTGAIWVYDTAYGTDAGAVKTAVSGIYLYYELATPVELPTLDFGE